MQTQSNKKLNPKISQAYKHCNDLGFLRLFIGLNMAWKLHWLFKHPRKSAVLFCKPLPSNPRGLKHHDHRYRLFFGSDLGSSCQCLSAASLGALKGKQQPFPHICLHIHRHLEHDEWNLREGLFIFSFMGLVPLMLEAVGIPTDHICTPWGICGTRKTSYKCKLWSKNTHLLGIWSPYVHEEDVFENHLTLTQRRICISRCLCLEGAFGHLVTIINLFTERINTFSHLPACERNTFLLVCPQPHALCNVSWTFLLNLWWSQNPHRIAFQRPWLHCMTVWLHKHTSCVSARTRWHCVFSHADVHTGMDALVPKAPQHNTSYIQQRLYYQNSDSLNQTI